MRVTFLLPEALGILATHASSRYGVKLAAGDVHIIENWNPGLMDATVEYPTTVPAAATKTRARRARASSRRTQASNATPRRARSFPRTSSAAVGVRNRKARA